MRRYLTELIGTFFLVFTVGCAVLAASPGMIPPLAIGSVLMVMVFAGGHVSGAHYNPAVTLAVWMRGRCATADVAPYMAFQLGGAVLGALAARLVTDSGHLALIQPRPGRALVAEVLFTFALVYVVLNVATSKGTAGNSFYGLAIGFTVLAGAFAVGGISGGVFNPAVAIGLSTMGVLPWSSLWIYLVANSLGAVAAALAFRAIELPEA